MAPRDLDLAVSARPPLALTELLRLQGRLQEGVRVPVDWLVERGLQLAAEIALDLGNHVLSAHFGVSASDYEDVLTQLAACGVIDAQLCERFGGLGGFRNLLVHGYPKLDADRVAEVLADAPERFSTLAPAIRAWLATVA